MAGVKIKQSEDLSLSLKYQKVNPMPLFTIFEILCF